MTQEEETRRGVIKYSFFPLLLSFLSCALLSRQARKSFLPPLASYLLCEEGQNALLAKSGRKRGPFLLLRLADGFRAYSRVAIP